MIDTQEVDEDGQPLGRPAISLEDIRNFRQLHSPCAGHPEYGDACGIEMTTGPLGQGIATTVGMAIASRWQAAYFNRPGFEIFDYNVYALASDGDIMEGIGAEAASLAGHLKLSNLCWIYDDNHITIEGQTSLAFSEDVAGRFKGLGWRVETVQDANDLEALGRALDAFLAESRQPMLIIVRSHIAYGAPNKQDMAAAHGAPLGEDEIRLTKAAYGWPENEAFLVPDGVREHFAEGIGSRGHKASEAWHGTFTQFAAKFPDLAEQWQLLQRRELPPGWDADIPTYEPDKKGIATRIASGQVLNAIAARVPWFIGGSADLGPSTMTLLKFEGAGDFSAENPAGRNLRFGVREHAMAAAGNGMTLSKLRLFVGTFFVFSDYLRPSLRLSAIMRLPVIYIFTHDSIGLGEDGTTHQPVEHLAAIRTIPRLITIRPGDANEVAQAYRTMMPLTDRPVALVLSRQALPTLDRTKYAAASGLARGAYVLADSAGGQPDVILIGTGSELPICVSAYEQLAADGVKVRLVSMPSFELFDEQDQAYRDEVLPPVVLARVAVEAGLQQGWERYIGTSGRFVGMSDFGASAPSKVLYEHFGITVDTVIAAAKASLALD